MKRYGYNVLPIVTDQLNLYKYGLVRHGSALVGCCNARRALVRQGLVTADRAFNECHFEC